MSKEGDKTCPLSLSLFTTSNSPFSPFIYVTLHMLSHRKGVDWNCAWYTQHNQQEVLWDDRQGNRCTRVVSCRSTQEIDFFSNILLNVRNFISQTLLCLLVDMTSFLEISLDCVNLAIYLSVEVDISKWEEGRKFQGAFTSDRNKENPYSHSLSLSLD